MPRLRRPSPATCIALLALFVALGGTTWAATSLPARSVGTAQLKSNAVTGPKVKDRSLTSVDIKLSSLGAVPTAKRALIADLATRATSADSAGAVYSMHFEAPVTLTMAPAVVASLPVPAGSYVLGAKGQVDTFASADIVQCDLAAGSDTDRAFVQAGTGHQSQILTNSLVHVFAVAGTVNLICTTFGTGGSLSQVRVTAMTVGSISSTP
jgi:hypothetical protein